MAVKISGVLKDGAGKPVVNCAIELRAKRTSPTVVVDIVATCFTGSDGGYAIDTEPGFYDVFLLREGYPPVKAGEIYVAPTDEPNTLNAFLDAPKDGDLRPEVMKRFEEMVNTVVRLSEQVSSDTERAETAATDAINAATSAAGSKDEAEELKNQAQQNAEAAAESERQAGQHAADAQKIKGDCQTLADNVQQNTNAVEENTQRVEQLASQVEDTAAEVRQDAEAAKKAASDAEQARADIDTALSATLKTANRLSELADEGEEAQQESRDNLGLKSAATMEAQSDIYDRTEGRLALAGGFGFGRMFRNTDVIRFESEADFLSWARNATPGEYFVDGGSKIISGGVLFNGVVSIRWVEASNNPPEPRYTAKVIIFYGINGDVYYSRYWKTGNGYLTGWERLKLGETGIADTLRSIAGRANNYGYPGIGGVVFAAYCINDMDEDGRIFRGSGVSGSRLAAISVTAPYSHNGLSTSTPQIVIAPPSAYPMAGTFVALSGEPTTKVSAGTSITGLFVRIM